MKPSIATPRSPERQPSTREEVMINILGHVRSILAQNRHGAVGQNERVEKVVVDVLNQGIPDLDADSLGALLKASPNVGTKRTLIEEILKRLQH